MKREKAVQKIISIYTILGFSLIILSIVIILIPISPYIWYRLNPNATTEEITQLVIPVTEEKIEEVFEDKTIPPFDKSLPEGYSVLIPRIGVNSEITAGKSYDEALKKGSWIVPNYGTPERDSLPIIVASHRFGYANWDIEQRNQISFFNLPKTKIGDSVEIYWNQRKYTYKIYKAEEKTYISDYEADLILYTCKYFNSPVRIFRYAQRVIE